MKQTIIIVLLLCLVTTAHGQVGGSGIYGIPQTPTVTAGSGTGVTILEYGTSNQQIYKVTVAYTALSAAALTADKIIATIPAKTKIVGFYADTTTKYVGGAVSAATMMVGTAAGGAQIIASHDVFTAVTMKGLADADMGSSLTRATAIQGGYFPSWSVSTDIYVRLTTVTANTNAITQGVTTFYLVTEKY